MPIIKESLSNGNNVRFSPRGTSMLPMLRQGKDSVVISPIKGKLKKYDLPLYQRDNGQYVLHRIVAVGDTYTCIGDNQFVYEYDIRQDQLIGVVTAFERDDKKYSTNIASYRLYCIVWHYSRVFRKLWRKLKSKIKEMPGK